MKNNVLFLGLGGLILLGLISPLILKASGSLFLIIGLVGSFKKFNKFLQKRKKHNLLWKKRLNNGTALQFVHLLH